MCICKVCPQLVRVRKIDIKSAILPPGWADEVIKLFNEENFVATTKTEFYLFIGLGAFVV